MDLKQQIDDLIAANPTHKDSIKTAASLVVSHFERLIQKHASRAAKRQAGSVATGTQE